MMLHRRQKDAVGRNSSVCQPGFPNPTAGMKTRRHLLLLATLMFASGCSPDDGFRIEGSQARLNYDCLNLRVLVSSPAERALMLDYAGRILRYETEDENEERVTSIRDAFRADDDEALEIALAEYGCEFGMGVADRVRFPDRGSPPPVFVLPVLGDHADEGFSLIEHRGRIVVLNFWSTWCFPCRNEYPELQEIAREFAADGVVVAGVLYRDTPTAAMDWIREQGGGFPILLDDREEVARAYRVRGLPRTLIIDRDGTVIDHWTGFQPGHVIDRVRGLVARG